MKKEIYVTPGGDEKGKSGPYYPHEALIHSYLSGLAMSNDDWELLIHNGMPEIIILREE